MKDEEKREYLEEYQEAKKRGIPFFPDAIFKDAVVALLVFLALVGLAAFIGSELDEPADPAAEFDPRPEWYFLFLFQLLKHFPGNLEFVGAVVLPTVVIILLFALPWLDRSRRRHILARPVVLGVSLFVIAGVVLLSVQALLETPPPSGVEAAGDPVAALYTDNCAGCHGGVVTVPEGVDLITVITTGGHEGMPSWSADLSSDEIDALAGFILSPSGFAVFESSCAECHEVADLSAASPSDFRAALQEGTDFAPHAGAGTPDFAAVLSPQSRTALLNFLVAPDGQRLFAVNCSSCHGSAVAWTGSREELRQVIEQGGQHLDMPAMGAILSDTEVAQLADYVVMPTGATEGSALFARHCTTCHGGRIPTAETLEEATVAITQGGGHEDMPVWGEILTEEQLDALTDYALEAARGTPVMAGQELYAANCVVCHGEFGEGGPNPANPAQIIPPISTAGYLSTRDDFTLRAIISQGQPDFGMSPFGLAFGGSLDGEDVDALVAFIRSWQDNPPVELPPEVQRGPLAGTPAEVYEEFCAQCHGLEGEGGIGPSFQDPAFQTGMSDAELVETIDLGHAATAMIAWGEVLTDPQIEGLVEFIRRLGGIEGAEVSFANDVLPIFEAECVVCHGASGNWAADSYQAVMGTGDSAPVVIPGDPDESVLVQRLEGTEGALMPPAGKWPDSQIQLVRDWIAAGAQDN